MKITTVVVDDEPLDRELLQNLIKQYCTSMVVMAEAATVEQAVNKIHECKPDVVFLDISMPTGNGFLLVDKFPDRSFKIVFVTGSDEYGIKAVKANAFDYLLKPIDVNELIAVEQKILKASWQQHPAGVKVFTNGSNVIINPTDIVCLEAEGSYAKIYLKNGTSLLISRNLKQVIAEISTPLLKRVHRSFVVNVACIERYQNAGNEMVLYLLNGVVAHVSKKYRAALKQFLV